MSENENEQDVRDNNKPSEDIVNDAIARMKSGAVVKEERVRKTKFVVIGAAVIAGLAAFSTLDFVYKKPDSVTSATGETVVTLKQDPSGHYLAKGEVNGYPVRFIVDTGASSISLPLDIAKTMGLPLGREITTKTANGFGTAFETNLDSVKLGDIELTNVRARATAGLIGDEALLGMTFLSHTKIEQHNGVMKITY